MLSSLKRKSLDKRISFIILSWNSQKYLEKCFDSIIALCDNDKIGYEIIVIDNGSNDNSEKIINIYKAKYPQIFIAIMLPENIGTTRSRNIGLKKSKGRYICILDSDTEILSNSFSKMTTILDNNSDIGIIAPQLILPNGAIQNSVKRFPTLLHKILKIPKVIFSLKIKDFDFYDKFPFSTEKYVDTAISACWLLSRELTLTIGLLDENIFYAPEDVEYCMRIRKAGKKVLYYPHVKILHNTQQISHKSPFSRLSISHFFGLLYYFKKHRSWFTNP